MPPTPESLLVPLEDPMTKITTETLAHLRKLDSERALAVHLLWRAIPGQPERDYAFIGSPGASGIGYHDDGCRSAPAELAFLATECVIPLVDEVERLRMSDEIVMRGIANALHELNEDGTEHGIEKAVEHLTNVPAAMDYATREVLALEAERDALRADKKALMRESDAHARLATEKLKEVQALRGRVEALEAAVAWAVKEDSFLHQNDYEHGNHWECLVCERCGDGGAGPETIDHHDGCFVAALDGQGADG